MESLVLLWKVAAEELGGWCHTSTARDLQTVHERVTHEGLSFLTISLPQFCQDFQKGLEQGFVDSTLFAGFGRRSGLPKFLSGFLSRVFSSDGRLLDNPSSDAVQAVRQLTLMFSKINLPCSEERTEAALARFVQCEKDVREADKRLVSDDLDRINRVGSLLFADLFSQVDLMVYNGDLLPKHGPGNTADRLVANQKWSQTEWTQRLDALFPVTEYLFPSHRYWREAQLVDILEPGAERPVRVVTVPKTLKTPRIIAIEPTCMQYMQQALLDRLVDGVQRSSTLYSFIGFDDQVTNQIMAKEGSLTGAFATLDLSDASDRVSNQHVRALLRNHPWLFQAVDATRSRKADVPGKGVIRLAKFASMGSALCFPFEAMVFLTVIFIGIEQTLNRHLTRSDIESYSGRVRVYGDDIITPIDKVESVVRSLEHYGFKVNRHKSFWTGRFRESCGKEYFSGDDVTCVKVRSVLPVRRTDSEELVSSVALRNNFYCAGMWQTARHMDDLLRRFLDLPRIHPSSPSLGRHSFLPYQVDKMDDDLHSPLVKGYAVVPRIPASPLGGLGALLKFFLKRMDEPYDKDHLQKSGRPASVDIKRRWIRPF